MKFKIATPIFQKFPKLCIGVIVAKNIDNAGSHKKIDTLVEGVERYIQLTFTPKDLAKHPLISPWRTAYSEFGSKPSKFPSSIEAMTKRILSGKKIPRVNKLVDLYNYLSLKHMIPLGAYDMDKIDGNIFLTNARGTEVFVPLNTDEIENPEPGEIVYKDDRKILCRRWNYRDSNSSKTTEETKNAVLFVEGIPPIDASKVEEVCKEIVDLIRAFCSGDIAYSIVDIVNNELEI